MGIGDTKDILTAWKPDEFLARISAPGPGEDATATLSAVLSESKNRISNYLEGPGSSEIVSMMAPLLEYVKMLSNRIDEKQKPQTQVDATAVLPGDNKATAGGAIAELIKFSENMFQELSRKPNQDTVTLTERYNSLRSLLNEQ